MSQPTLFAVYTMQLPFLDMQAVKVRPVIVISKPHSKHRVVAIIPLSSKPQREDADVIINHWKDAGLVKPSIARVHRLTTILQSDLLTELGQLTPRDITALKSSIRTFLSI